MGSPRPEACPPASSCDFLESGGTRRKPGSREMCPANPTSVPCPKRGCPADRAGKACFDSRGMALPKGRVHKERAALAARQLKLTRD